MTSSVSKTLRRYPLTIRFLALVALPVAVAAVAIYVNLKHSLPGGQFLLQDKSLSAPVDIRRDMHGVPHIQAQSDNDAFFAIGYVHAQDRLWQLELQRRMGQGRLSEIFGRTSVAQDTWLRTLGLHESAKQAWPTLSQPARDSLSAYTRGVNAGMAAQSTLPPEFGILGIRPGAWTEIDSLTWIKLFALDLGGNFRKETARFVANQALTQDEFATFFPEHGKTGPSLAQYPQQGQNLAAQQASIAMLALQQQLEQGLHLGGRAVGSNAWVVAGSKTANGAALLANDPHLGLQVPSLWYVLTAKGKNLNVSGMNMVGLPLVIFGHNDHISWGGTNMMADTQDLYFLRLDPANPARYEVDGGQEAFRRRVESIPVRADLPEILHKQYQPVKIEVRSTRHGPVISDQFSVYGQTAALRWTALAPDDTSYEAFYRLGFANDWTTFKRALQWHVAPTLNMLYADRLGNIGYLGAGRIPVRKNGTGSIPVPGWNQAHEWQGYVPPAQWPQSYNPQTGYIISANHKMIDDSYPWFISHDWASPARAQRIEQLLRATAAAPYTATDMQHMQADTLDLEAQALLPELLKMPPLDSEQALALNYLKQWNGDMAQNSQAAAIFHVWMRHFRVQLFHDKLRGYWNQPAQAGFIRELEQGVSLASLKTILQRQDTPWCGRGHASCNEQLQTSLHSALSELRKFRSDRSMQSWKWGDMQKTVYPHTPFSDIKPLDRLFEIEAGNGGSENSINVAGNTWVENKGYLQGFGPGFRQVITLDPRSITLDYMNSTGQSGNIMSPHYADMVLPFRNVQYFRLRHDQAASPGPATTAATPTGTRP